MINLRRQKIMVFESKETEALLTAGSGSKESVYLAYEIMNMPTWNNMQCANQNTQKKLVHWWHSVVFMTIRQKGSEQQNEAYNDESMFALNMVPFVMAHQQWQRNECTIIISNNQVNLVTIYFLNAQINETQMKKCSRIAQLNGVDKPLFINKTQSSGGPTCRTSIFSTRLISESCRAFSWLNNSFRFCRTTSFVTAPDE